MEGSQKSMTEFRQLLGSFWSIFVSVRRTNNRRKVAALWDSLNQGNLTVEEAVALKRNRRNDFPVVSIRIDGK
jgi:hypothetical protein